MKKIALIGLLCLMTFTLTGCKKFTYNFELDDKGNLTVYETESINFSALETFPGAAKEFQTSLEEVSNQLKSEGYEVKDFDDGTYKGLTKFKKAKSYTKYKNSELPAGFTSLQAAPIYMEKAFLKNKYSIKWSYDFRFALESSSNKEENYSPNKTSYSNGDADINMSTNTNGASYSNHDKEIMQDAFENAFAPMAELTISIPQKATSTNAKSFIVEGKKHTYKWDLSSVDEPTNIELIYEKVDYTGSMMVISFILLFIGLVVVMIKMKEESSF